MAADLKRARAHDHTLQTRQSVQTRQSDLGAGHGADDLE